MNYQKITAFIAAENLQAVGEALQHLNVAEVAVSHIKGYGEYKNFYDPRWVPYQARVEVFVPAAKAQPVVDAIMQVAHTGLDTDGIIAVLPVEMLYSIRTLAPLPAHDELATK